MSSTLQTDNARINLRLKHNSKRMLEHAASLEGQTVSKFVLHSALSRAEKTIQQHEVMSLNARDSEAFLNALAAPIRFNDKLATAFEEHDRRIAGE